MRTKKNSIIKKIILLMMLILIIQSLLFVGIISISGIISKLNENTFNVLNDKVREKNSYLNNQMLQYWGNIEKNETIINSYILNELNNKGVTTTELNKDSNLANEILMGVSNEIIAMLREHSVTGAFIVLDTDENNQPKNEDKKKEGFYIRDLDPESNSQENLDLLIDRGSADIAEKYKIPMSSHWKSKVVLDEVNSIYERDFFYKPINEAKRNKNIKSKDLGYWSRPATLTEDTIQVITYSVPLIDNKGNPYGIIGIDLTVDYINKLLKKDDINRLDSYIIAVRDNEKLDFDNVTGVGEIGETISQNFNNISFNVNKIYTDIYELKENENYKNTVYGCIKYLNLYNTNTPFDNEKWAVIGVSDKNNVLYYVNKLKTAIIISVTISGIIGILFALISGNLFTKSIRGLAKKVRESDPQEPLKLDKINISEIDDLSLAIMILSNKVVESATALSRILELLNMPIGAFEYKKNDEKVYCTKGFFSIIGINITSNYEKGIDNLAFKLIMEEITENPEENFHEVYKIVNEGEFPKWIRLKVKMEETRIFGVITDVTEEVIEKQKILYERDHDTLTGILNRRAFRRIVIQKLEESSESIAAMIMIDLDNLKYVNDTYGHDSGDNYIKQVANELREFKYHKGIVSRRSGDEFMIFIYGYKDKDSIRNIIKRVHEKMKNTLCLFENTEGIKIRASIGIAWYPDDSKEYKKLTSYADFAMYKVKHTVKGNVGEFNEEEFNKEEFLFKNKEELNKLIDGELVRYAFQPIVDAHTGEIFAYEALMRSQIDTIKSPFHIISLATAESKLYEIERLTWFKSLEAYVDNKDYIGDARLFINSIPNYVLSDEDSKKFEDKYGEYIPKLVVELLENERSNSEYTLKKRKLIEKWNAKLAIDDFGSGYNNEATLLEITPNFVKIDMEIIRGIHEDVNRQQITKNLIDYAKGRNIKIIAEGVETREELEKIIELGADYIQGYYFSKPEFTPPKIKEELVEEVKEISKKYF